MNIRFRVLQLVAIPALALMAMSALFLSATADGQPPLISETTTNQESNLLPGIDLDVTFINRAPLYKAYCVEYPWDIPGQPGIPFLCPGTEDDRRWPEPGEMVTFTAHIINKGTLTSPGFSYAWYIDNIEVLTGSLGALAPAAEVTVTLQWPWPHDLSPDGQQALGEHTVRFTADPANAVTETYETNNSLEDRTNAASFSIYLTPEMYEAYNTPVDPKYPFSAEDWLQKQIAAMNNALASSIYPATPQGAAVRVRINTIAVTSTDPGPDGAHDGGWFLNDDVRCEGCGYYDPITDIDWGLVHELSHQISLIDLYAIGTIASDVTALAQDGLPANMSFLWNNGGIMFGGDTAPLNNPHLYSSHSAGGASTYAGYRNGYYGSYLYDIPAQNFLRILDNQGNPVQGVAVSLYQRTFSGDARREFVVDNTPEMSGTTDEEGIFPLVNRPVNGGTTTANGHTLHDNPFGMVDIIGNQDLFLIGLVQGSHQEFYWLDITQFNLAYWMGDVTSHTFTIFSHIPPAGAPLAPKSLRLRAQGAFASLDWEPIPTSGVTGYRVYRASAPQYRYVDASGLLTGTHFEESAAGYGDGDHRIYTVTAVGADGRESGFGELVYAPVLGNPTAIALAPDGSRTILNNPDFYPLLRQQVDSRYTHRLVNVEYDLANAHSLAYDPAGRLLVSGFGRFLDETYAVRVYDTDMTPLWAFGEEGSDPGQFLSPAGIATWGPSCSLGGPYELDAHTLLLLHFNGDYSGVQGEVGTANSTTFVPGRFDQGVYMDGVDTLTYPVTGNLNHTRGAVEFWVRPDWDGDDGGDHTLFWWSDDLGRLHLRKDEISNLVFDYFYAGGGCGAPTNVAAWQAGEWHHLGFTWDENEIRLYVDGREVSHSVCEGTAKPEEPVFYIGSNTDGSSSAEAVIDELRISDMPRVGNSDTCSHILVADSGNHRLQAVDSMGNWIANYGSLGSGVGQFNNPQGLVVDKEGKVIVVDQGNNRLVILSYDGAAFTYLDSLTAGLNAPTDVALGPQGHIVVADTGNNRIVVLEPGGGFLAEYSEPNDGFTGIFNAPRGVAVELNGTLVVADTGNQRVVTIRGALPGTWRTWLPMLSRGWAGQFQVSPAPWQCSRPSRRIELVEIICR